MLLFTILLQYLCIIEIGGFRGFNSRISVSGREKDAGDRECV